MVAKAKPYKQVVWEDAGATCLAYVVGNDAAAITVASISTITRHIFDLDTSTTTDLDNSSVTVATAVFDTLQTDGRWTVDSTGYNFRDVIGASLLSTGGNRYRVEYIVTPASGEKFPLVYELTTEALYVS